MRRWLGSLWCVLSCLYLGLYLSLSLLYDQRFFQQLVQLTEYVIVRDCIRWQFVSSFTARRSTQCWRGRTSARLLPTSGCSSTELAAWLRHCHRLYGCGGRCDAMVGLCRSAPWRATGLFVIGCLW